MGRHMLRIGAIFVMGAIVSLALLPAGSQAILTPPGHHPGLRITTARNGAARNCPRRNRARGVLHVAALVQPQPLNPISVTGIAFGGATTLYNLRFDDLFRLDDKARLVPMMAVNTPTTANGGIRDGGKAVTIRLKRGLRWSNGAEVTSGDFRFGWKVESDPATGPFCAGTCDVISRIDTPDRYTLVLHLRRAYAPLLSLVSAQVL